MKRLGKLWKGNDFDGGYVEVQFDQETNELIIGCLTSFPERISAEYGWAQEMISGVPSRNFIPG
jgi:hypothetical protein